MKKYKADFIVVGMGAAGAVVFNMLTEKGYKVIGIEAGGNYDNDPLILNSTNAPILESEYTWKFFYNQETIPNDDVITSDGEKKVLGYTTGRLLGGGSSINGLQYVRADDDYWDRWGAINGPKWDKQAALHGYKKLEKFYGVPGQYNPIYHGFNGKMKIRQAPVTETSMAVKFATALAAATESSIINDYNDPNTPLGTFTRWSLFQQENGDRASSSTDFLGDFVDENGNYLCHHKTKIFQNTTVTKVLFSGNKAIGVEAIHNGACITLECDYEVILSCGIYSNEILQRSGIGNKNYLKSLKIPVIYDNHNVGLGSKNHLINTAVFTAPIEDSPGTGDDPDALYVGGAFLPLYNGPDRRGFQWIGVNTSPGLFAIVFYNLDPQSVGTDEIQDKDPFRISAVSERLLSDPIDLQRIIDVYQQQIVALNNEFLLNYPGYQLILPSLKTINDKKLITQHIKDTIAHTHHWTGTCKMAPLDEGGVVNKKGEVYGVKNLRVADISVAPIQPNGNTAGPAMFVGYNIAKQIIKEYSKC